MEFIKWDKPLALKIYSDLTEDKGGPLKTKEILAAGYGTLPNKIIEYWGSKANLDVELGFKPTKLTWNKENTKERYHQLCIDNGNKPVTQSMIRKSYQTLPLAIVEYYTSKANLELELGYKPFRIKWTKNSVKIAYQQLCIDNGGQPVTQQELCVNNSALNSAIHKFYKYKSKLELELGYTPNLNFTRTKESTKSEYRELCDVNGGSLTNNDMKRVAVGLSSSIRKFYGDKEALDLELGYVPTRISRTKEEAISEYRELCLKHGDKPLTLRELDNLSQGLSAYIDRYFDHKRTLDTLVGYPETKIWDWSLEKVTKVYHEICLEYGDKPISSTELIEMGRHDLVTAFSRFGKKTDIEISLGYEPSIKYWEKDEVKETYRQLCEEYDCYPIGDTTLINLGHTALMGAIKRYYGKILLDAELGYNDDSMYLLINGLAVRSHYEVLFGNFLIHNDIEFEVDKRISETTRYRYDFKLIDLNGNELYIEIWGVPKGDAREGYLSGYNEKREKKEKVYVKEGKRLLSLEAKTFKERNYDSLQTELKSILVDNNIKLNNFHHLTVKELIRSQNSNKWDREKVKDLYSKLCVENGDMPATKLLSGMMHAIRKYWGSKRALDKHLGYRPLQTRWTNSEIFIKYQEICFKLGLDSVGSKQMRPYSGALESAIYREFKSMGNFRLEYEKWVNCEDG